MFNQDVKDESEYMLKWHGKVTNVTQYEVSDHMAALVEYLLFNITRSTANWEDLGFSMWQRDNHMNPGEIDRVAVWTFPRKGPKATDEPCQIVIGTNHDACEYAEQWDKNTFNDDVEEWAIFLQWLGLNY